MRVLTTIIAVTLGVLWMSQTAGARCNYENMQRRAERLMDRAEARGEVTPRLARKAARLNRRAERCGFEIVDEGEDGDEDVVDEEVVVEDE